MFALADVMIREQVHNPVLPRQRSQESGTACYIFFIGIHAFDQGNTKIEIVSGFCNHPEIGQDQFVRDTAIFRMLGRIHLLQIDKEKLAIIHHVAYDLRPGEQRRIDSPMYPPFPATT